jgi:hypothetical protein
MASYVDEVQDMLLIDTRRTFHPNHLVSPQRLDTGHSDYIFVS